jgi:hypothetical protein
MFLRTKYRSQNLLNLILIQREIIVNTIVLKPGPARRVDPGRSRPGAGKKRGKVMIRCDPVKNPVTTRCFFFFLLKQRCFDFLKNRN